MSVTSTIYSDLLENSQFEISNGIATINETHLHTSVAGISNAGDMGDLLNLYPDEYSAYSATSPYDKILLRRKTATPKGGKQIRIMTMWSGPWITESTTDLVVSQSYRFSGVLRNVVSDLDKDGNVMYVKWNKNGGVIAQNDGNYVSLDDDHMVRSDPQNLEKTLGVIEIETVYLHPTTGYFSFASNLLNAMGSVNTNASTCNYGTFPARTLRIEDVNCVEQKLNGDSAITQATVTVRFVYKEETWDFWLAYIRDITHRVPTNAFRDFDTPDSSNGYSKHYVYQETDFSTLSLGWT